MNYNYYKPLKKILLPANQRIILVGGCFDILHFGHIQFLQKAKETGDYLVVALEPDNRIIQDKKRNPIHTQDERAHNLLSLRDVNHVIALPALHGFDDYLLLVKNINPHVIAVTQQDPQMNNKKKQATAIGAELVVVTDIIKNFSSSKIAPLI